jgi:hypothetical protein
MGLLVVVGTLLAVQLSGCAAPADPKAMAITAQATDKPFPGSLQHAMCVRTVTGGEETNPMWASKVDNKGFQEALETTLTGVGLAAPADGCSYPIDVNLLGLSQPSMGFDMTVTAHVNYKVYDPSGQPFVLATIDAPYTATVSDAFAGVKRLKLANEGSIKLSIQLLLDKLRESDPK